MKDTQVEDTHYEILEQASLERIIFHIVGPNLEGPNILMEVDTPEDYSAFFIDRLRETLKGTRYIFKEDSWVRGQVNDALVSPYAFVDASERLAEKFQELFQSDKRLVPGALMLLKIKNGEKIYGAIIKYDDMSVISYKTKLLEDGKEKPILSEFLNNFVQDKKAIQKSVVFDIDCPQRSMICTDRSGSKGDITDKLKGYLSADRLFTETLLTERLIAALEETGKSQMDLIPIEIRKKLKSRVKQAVRDTVEFDPENHEQILTAAFGEAHAEDGIKKAFSAALKKRKIQDEKFAIERSVVKDSPKRVKETYEGVKVIYSESNVGENIFFEEDGGKKVVRIITDFYVREDDTDD